MSALSSTAALPLIATLSIAAPGPGIPRDLAARFGDLYDRWREQRRRDELEIVDDLELTSWDGLNSELFELQSLIMGFQARTVGDLVLQARTCALVNNDLWTDAATVESADAGTRAQRRILESVAALAGAELLPGVATIALT